MLKKFAKTLQTHWDGILAYYDYRISTGPLEGTNNKIKTMKRQAYGYRDNEFLKLKIMAIHLAKYALDMFEADFRRIYVEGTIYSRFSQRGSYPHFSVMPRGCDYLTNTIKT